MAIHFMCPNGHELSAPEERAGKPGKCPKCQTEFLVPDLEEEEGAGADAGGHSDLPASHIVFLCPNGHKLNGPASLKGKPGKCPHCGAKFLIPADDDEEESHEAIAPEPAEPAAFSPPPATHRSGRQVPFSPDYLSPPQLAAEDDAVEVVEVVEQPDEDLPIAEHVLELVAPPLGPAIHPLHHLLGWLCEQRQQEQPILVRLKDGEVLQIDYFAPELSRASFAVFATREANDRHSLILIAWDDIARLDLHKLKSLTDGMFL